MDRSHTYELHAYVEERNSGARYHYVESVHLNNEPVSLGESLLLALLMGTGATDAELPVAPARGLPPNLSRAVEEDYIRERPQHPTWLSPAELAEVEARHHALTGQYEPQIQRLLERMEGHSDWRVVVWLIANA